VAVVRFEGKPVQESTLSQVGVYLFLWLILAVIGTILSVVWFANRDGSIVTPGSSTT
jgi:hypothetical protein